MADHSNRLTTQRPSELHLREICRIAQKVGLHVDADRIDSPEKAMRVLRTLRFLEARGMW